MKEKPPCKLINEDGDIFFILGRVRRALKEHGQEAEVEAVTRRVMNAKSYDEALGIITEYIEPE